MTRLDLPWQLIRNRTAVIVGTCAVAFIGWQVSAWWQREMDFILTVAGDE